MAQSGFTPIKIYSSGTAAAQPLAANLALGELALNYTDGKIYYKNGAGTVLSISSVAATPIVENENTISVNRTITVGSNGESVGPITVNTGVTLTVGANQRYIVF
jgi:hypothetical protein